MKKSNDIPFLKMHGLGNDFVIIDARENNPELSPAEIKAIANRRTGVGFDQMVLLKTAQDADVLMQIINADATDAGACGNATRCVAKILFEETKKNKVTIKTANRTLFAEQKGDLITVDMGEPVFEWEKIPLAEKLDALDLPPLGNGTLKSQAVSMGNPHLVCLVNDAEKVDLATIGKSLEHHPLFPERTNVEFINLVAPNQIRMRVWERGAGITPACGTGACASLVAAINWSLVKEQAEIILDGGSLYISWQKGQTVKMSGTATLVYSGNIKRSALL